MMLRTRRRYGLIAAGVMVAASALAAPAAPPAQARSFGPCTAAFFTGSTSWNAGAGSRFATVTLTHTGEEQCGLSGRPSLELLDQGVPLAVPQVEGPNHLQAELTGAAGIVVRPGQQVQVSARWSNYCGETSGAEIVPRLTFSLGSQLEARAGDGRPLTSPPPCLGPLGTTLAVSEYHFAGDAVRVVEEYIGLVAMNQYAAAYALLGPDLQAEQSLESFVAGYSNTVTAAIAVDGMEQTEHDGTRLHVRLGALHTDGAIVRFEGTYDVASVDGELTIVAANIRLLTGNELPPPAGTDEGQHDGEG